MEDIPLTPEEQDELNRYLDGQGYGAPIPDEKQTAHSFLHNVARSKDTTKTGFLDTDELGTPKLPLRTLKELSLFCRDIYSNRVFENFFNNMAEIQTSTSLSKNAKLLELAIVTRREVADVTKKPMRENKGWFKPKNSPQQI